MPLISKAFSYTLYTYKGKAMIEEQYRSIVLNSPFGYAYLKVKSEAPLDFEFIDVNDKLLWIMNKERKELLGRRYKELKGIYFVERMSYILENLSTKAVEDEQFYFESVKKYFNIKVLPQKNGDFVIYLIEKTMQYETMDMTYMDYLTGLINRRKFLDYIYKYDMQKRYPMSISLVDIDGLKKVNDDYGYSTGDLIIKSVANIIKECCHKKEIISGRTGGDEFGILIPKTSFLETQTLLYKIKNQFQAKDFCGLELTLSIGFDIKYDNNQSIMNVYKKAEDNLNFNKISCVSSIRHYAINAIIKTLYAKCPREEMHSRRVSNICKKFAKAIKMNEEAIENLKTVGLMHDVGKVAVDEEILNKPAKLTDAEWYKIKRHPEMGYNILNAVKEFEGLAEIVYQHHERWDGKGYPKGLKADEIISEARMIAIADAYDSMTNDRSYRKAKKQEDAIREIKNNAGKQFDPYLCKVFVEKVLKCKW
ncbi:MAG: diguanylate cyclase [Bacillota bacterium]